MRTRIDVSATFGHQLRLARQQLAIVGRMRPHEQADRLAAPGQRIVTGLLDQLPHHLQHFALLRVHAFGLATRDAEKRSIESINVVEETRIARQLFAREAGIGAHRCP